MAWVERVHKRLVNGLMVLISLHVMGVVLSSRRHRENLVAAMVTGEKDHDGHLPVPDQPGLGRRQRISVRRFFALPEGQVIPFDNWPAWHSWSDGARQVGSDSDLKLSIARIFSATARDKRLRSGYLFCLSVCNKT